VSSSTPTYEEVIEMCRRVIDRQSVSYVSDSFVLARFILALDESGRLKKHVEEMRAAETSS